MAVLDWGRAFGHMTTLGTGRQRPQSENGESFGFNLGYGFGDTSAAPRICFFIRRAQAGTCGLWDT